MSPSADPHLSLGPFVREHPLRWSYAIVVLLVGSVFTLGGLLGVGRALYLLATDGASEDLYAPLVASFVFLFAGALVLGWGAVRLVRVVRLYQGGFSFKDRKGEQVVRWVDIDGVYQKIVRVYQAGAEVDVQDTYTIALRDGTMIVVDYHFAEIDSFGAAVTSAVTDALLPFARQAFRAGQPLDFGPVRIDGWGVHAEGKSLHWNEVQGFSWKQGILSSDRAFLQIRRVGGLLAWAKLPIEQIKNYPVLMQVAADIGKAE